MLELCLCAGVNMKKGHAQMHTLTDICLTRENHCYGMNICAYSIFNQLYVNAYKRSLTHTHTHTHTHRNTSFSLAVRGDDCKRLDHKAVTQHSLSLPAHTFWLDLPGISTDTHAFAHPPSHTPSSVPQHTGIFGDLEWHTTMDAWANWAYTHTHTHTHPDYTHTALRACMTFSTTVNRR